MVVIIFFTLLIARQKRCQRLASAVISSFC